MNEFSYKFSQWWWKDEGLVGRQNILSTIFSLYYLKSVQMRSFSWPVFSCIRTEYGDSWSKSSYSVQIQENTDYKKLRIWNTIEHYFSRSVGDPRWREILILLKILSNLSFNERNLVFQKKSFEDRKKPSTWQ